MSKYNIISMRAHPPHKGHQYLIDQASVDGIPVVVFGSTQESGTERNPYTLEQRQEMLQLIYPGIASVGVADRDSWDEWYQDVLATITPITGDSKIEFYSFYQEEDLCNFTFRGVTYTNAKYHELFEAAGFKVNYIVDSPIKCHARHIREDLEANKQYLDPKVYDYIKDLNAN